MVETAFRHGDNAILATGAQNVVIVKYNRLPIISHPVSGDDDGPCAFAVTARCAFSMQRNSFSVVAHVVVLCMHFPSRGGRIAKSDYRNTHQLPP
jgi:uncharacterized membrane protein